MKPTTIGTSTALGRLATADEILAAVHPFPDPIERCAAQNLTEIASDLGGFVRIPVEEFETSFLLEELLLAEDARPN